VKRNLKRTLAKVTWDTVFKGLKDNDMSAFKVFVQQQPPHTVRECLNHYVPNVGFPLFALVQAGYVDAVKIALQYGAKVTFHDPELDGNTVLHEACVHGRMQCISVLLKYGASPTAKNDAGQVCHEVADTFDQEEIAAYVARDMAKIQQLQAFKSALKHHNNNNTHHHASIRSARGTATGSAAGGGGHTHYTPTQKKQIRGLISVAIRPAYEVPEFAEQQRQKAGYSGLDLLQQHQARFACKPSKPAQKPPSAHGKRNNNHTRSTRNHRRRHRQKAQTARTHTAAHTPPWTGAKLARLTQAEMEQHDLEDRFLQSRNSKKQRLRGTWLNKQKQGLLASRTVVSQLNLSAAKNKTLHDIVRVHHPDEYLYRAKQTQHMVDDRYKTEAEPISQTHAPFDLSKLGPPTQRSFSNSTGRTAYDAAHYVTVKPVFDLTDYEQMKVRMERLRRTKRSIVVNRSNSKFLKRFL
jgi:hypothetical protein